MKIDHLILLCLIIFQACAKPSSTLTKSDLSFLRQMFPQIDTKDSLHIQGVKSIPSEVFQRSELKYLSVRGQDCDIAGVECFALTEIPPEIKKLTQLEHLKLELNYIRKLPVELLELKKLRVLDLTENPGFKDVERVAQMTWLQSFYCFGCHLPEEDVERLKKTLPNCKIGVE